MEDAKLMSESNSSRQEDNCVCVCEKEREKSSIYFEIKDKLYLLC